MQLNPIPTELTTAATDVAFGVLAVGCMSYLVRFREHDQWKAWLWSWLFGLLAAAIYDWRHAGSSGSGFCVDIRS